MQTRVIELDEESVAELRSVLKRYNKTLALQYFGGALILLAAFVTAMLFTGYVPTERQIGGAIIMFAVIWAGYALPNLSNGEEIRLLLTWSGNGNSPEIKGRFGFENAKGSFYAVETVQIAFGTYVFHPG